MTKAEDEAKDDEHGLREETTLEGVIEKFRENSNKSFDDIFPDGLSHDILTELVRHILSWEYKKTKDALRIITFLLAKKWPNDSYDVLSSITEFKVCKEACNKNIEEGSFVFQCLTCQQHFSSIICIDCFRKGNHENHEYYMIRANGGFCDCGNVELWKREGFCSDHVGNLDEDDEIDFMMSKDDQQKLRWTILEVSDKIYRNCIRFHTVSDWHASTREGVQEEHADSISSTFELVSWLKTFLSSGQDLRRFIGEILAYPEQNGWLYSMLKLDGVGRLPAKVHRTLHEVYTELIMDVKIKRSFVASYIASYPIFIDSLVHIKKHFQFNHNDRPENYENDIITKFSGHILSSPKCVPFLIQEDGLLEVQLHTTLRLLEASASVVLPYKAIDVETSRYATDKSIENEPKTVYGTEKVELPSGPLPVTLEEILSDSKIQDFESVRSKLRDLNETSQQGIPRSNLLLAVLANHAFQPLHNLQRLNYQLVSEEKSDLEIPEGSENTLQSYYTSLYKELKIRNKECRDGSGNISHLLRIHWFQSHIMTSVFWKVFFELRYVVANISVSTHLMHHRPDLFRMILRILSIFQGTSMNSRLFDEHIAMESDTWAKALNLEISLADFAQFISDGFCRNPTGIDSKQNDRNGKLMSGKESRIRCINIARQCLNEWIDRERRLEMMSVHQGESFSAAHGTSIHLPLHRIFSLLLHHAIRIDGTSLRNDLSLTKEEAFIMGSHALRIQAFFSQAQAGLWVRNGDSVKNEQHYYRSNECGKWMADLDMFLLQTVATIVGTNDFVRETLFFYQIHNFEYFLLLEDFERDLRQGKKLYNKGIIRSVASIPFPEYEVNSMASEYSKNLLTKDDRIWNETSLGKKAFARSFMSNIVCSKYVASFAKDILVFFINIIIERSRCGYDDNLYNRNRLLHALSSSNLTRSELLHVSNKRLLMPHPDDEPSIPILDHFDVEPRVRDYIDNNLKEIALFEHGQDGDEGKYKMKLDSWNEYNRFSTCLSPKARNYAEEKYFAAYNGANLQQQPFPNRNITELPLFMQYSSLENIAISLCSNGEDSLSSQVLSRCLETGTNNDNMHSYMIPALYLACLSSEFAEKIIESDDVDEDKLTWVNNQIFSSSAESDIWCFGALRELMPMFNSSQTRSFSGTNLKSSVQLIADIYNQLDGSSSAMLEMKPGIERVLKTFYSSANDDQKAIFLQMFPGLMGDNKLNGSQNNAAEEDEELNKKREHRKRMQEKALKEIENSQNLFEMNLYDEFDSESDEESPYKSSLSLDKNLFQDLSQFLLETCALCQEKIKDGENIGLIGFAQKTKICCMNHKNEPDESEKVLEEKITEQGEMIFRQNGSIVPEPAFKNPECQAACQKFVGVSQLNEIENEKEGIHFNFCGHTVHAKCIEQYFGSILMRERTNEQFEGHDKVIAERGEFLCPVCRRMANFILPVSKLRKKVPSWVKRNSSESKIDESDALKSWFEENENKYTHIDHVSEKIENLDAFLGNYKTNETVLPDDQITLNKFGFHSRNILFEFGRWVKWSDDDRRQAKTLLFPGKISKSMRMGCVNVLLNSLLTTLVCSEISSRSGYWTGNEASRRRVGMLIHELQAQARDFPELSWLIRKIIWSQLHGVQTEDFGKVDEFACFVLMIILWEIDPSYDDIRFLLHLCLKSTRNHIDESKKGIEDKSVDRNSLRLVIFLRRCSVFLISYLDVDIELRNHREENVDIQEEITHLLEELHMPSPAMNDENGTISRKSHSTQSLRPVSLISLPENFMDLILSLHDRLKEECDEDQKNPALCLTSGELLCDLRTIRRHATEKGAGVGLFLAIRTLKLIVVRDFRVSTLGSLYLDDYGEEDPDLRRKNPLTLSKERYARIEKLWLLHELDYDFRVLNATRFQNLN